MERSVNKQIDYTTLKMDIFGLGNKLVDNDAKIQPWLLGSNIAPLLIELINQLNGLDAPTKGEHNGFKS